MKRILILASNPRKDLNLDREIRDLKGVIERSRNKAQFDVEIELAVRPDDLQELFLANEPRIVHFCGHGTGEQGLVLENDAGREQLVSTNALSSLFESFDNKVECVLLNACYSDVQANAIIQHINYVVGMSQEIRDDAAIAFATGFYRGLAYGKSIEQSYRLGCNAIQLLIDNNATVRSRSPEASRKLGAVDAVEQVLIPEHLKPRLKKKQHLTLFVELDSSTQLDIPPELIEALKEEVARKRYRDRTRKAWDDFGQPADSRVQPLTQQECRWRKGLLGNVNHIWIKGVLENSLHTNALIELKLKDRPDAVQHPFSGVEELPVEPDESFEGLQATEIFDQMGAGRTLLILGEPGSGKTITLLKLAQRLIDQTEQNLSRLIPVVFNLSSWASKRQTIDKWLIQELQEQYKVSKVLGKTWVDEQQLILLLDGLDEVKAEHRNACVQALNQFLEVHGITEMVVCCRIKDYEALSERLALRSAIYIQPLTSEQVYHYLDKADDQLTGLKTLLQQDAELRNVAKTPLILSVMSLAYQGYSSTELLAQVGSAEERYKRLFDTYIERMLKRRAMNHQYLEKQTKSYLNWLAKQMSREDKTVFLIERMQPNYLKKTDGLIYNLILWLIVFLVASACGVLFTMPLLFITSGLFIIGSIVWIVSDGYRISPVEKLRWSWRKAINSLLYSLFISPILGLLTSFVYVFILSKNSMSWTEELSFIDLILGIVILSYGIGITMSLIRGLNGASLEDIDTTMPNQGIFRSIKYSVFFAFSSYLLAGLVAYLIDFPKEFWSTFGLFLGFACGGGAAALKHLVLRLILYLRRDIPWNYARFLNYCTERLFLQKVGGGYIFVHRMLREHFAHMKLD